MSASARRPDKGASPIDYTALIKENRVHSSVYYDEQIFQDELENICCLLYTSRCV